MIQKIPVIEYKKDFSYTEITLCFPGGSSLEDDKTLGYAHFCEHLAFKLKFKGKSIFEFVSELGGSSNAYTSNDVIAFEISVQSKYALKVLAFMEKLFAESFILPSSHFQTAKLANYPQYHKYCSNLLSAVFNRYYGSLSSFQRW